MKKHAYLKFILVGITKALIFVLFIFPTALIAQEICRDYTSEIEPDFRWKESDFSSQKGLAAIDVLKQILAEEKVYQWFDLPNILIVVEGSILKEAALKSSAESDVDDYNKSAFCNFLMKTPIID